MSPNFERTLLRLAVGLFALIPISAGIAGIWLGAAMTGEDVRSISLDSHVRYLSGILLAIGLAFWATLPAIERHTARFRLLTFLVFVGGLGRLLGIAVMGLPSKPMLGGLVMELVVTPLICLWQMRVARNATDASVTPHRR
jgi:hypothetical protein